LKEGALDVTGIPNKERILIGASAYTLRRIV
jgi:hypothetical protein